MDSFDQYLENQDQLELLGEENGEFFEPANREIEIQELIASFNDEEFKKNFRVSKVLFAELCNIFDSKRVPRGKFYSPKFDLLCLLSYLASGSFMFLTGKIAGLSISTCHRCIHRAMKVVASKFKDYVKFPEDLRDVQERFHAKYGISRIIGCVDGTHIPIQRPSIENAEIFRCRKGYFSINVQAICGPNNTFYDVVIRWPGSTHDSRIFENSSIYTALEQRQIEGVLLGDSGYPLKFFCVTPYRNPSNVQQKSNTLHFHRFHLIFYIKGSTKSTHKLGWQ